MQNTEPGKVSTPLAVKKINAWMDGWMDGWMVGWIDGWMDG